MRTPINRIGSAEVSGREKEIDMARPSPATAQFVVLSRRVRHAVLR